MQDTAAAPHAVAHLAAGGWAAAALLLGLFAAIVWIVATRRPALDAAIEIDRRFGLKERVSSTLALGPEDSQTEAGRALVDDAVRHVQRIDVATQFAPRPGKRILLPLLPGLPALLVALLISPAVVENQAKAGLDVQGAKQQVRSRPRCSAASLPTAARRPRSWV